MNWFIAGGLGFVGLNLINKLFEKFEKKNLKVIIYDSLKESKKSDLDYLFEFNPTILKYKRNIKFIHGDINNYNKLTKESKNSQYFINLAANTGVQPSIKNPISDATINILGNLNCLLAFEKNMKLKKFIFASSGAPIGNNFPPFNENSNTNPVSPYGVSKLSCEKYIEFFNEVKGLDCTALRFSNLYGPLSVRKSSLVSKVIKSIKNSKSITIFGNGKQTRDFLHVEDLCEAIISCCIKKEKLSCLYQLGSGKETDVNKVTNLIIKNFSYKIKKIYKKKLLGDVQRNFTKPKKFMREFHWRPKKKLNQGLNEVVIWYNKNY